MSEVRKRALDEDDTTHDQEDQSTKRLAKEQEDGEDKDEVDSCVVEDLVVMKLLCPTAIIGAIIGRGGSVLNGLQTSTNSKITISQNNDYFPETNDRVIAITGQPATVMAGLAKVIDKMCEVTLLNDSKRLDSTLTAGSPSQCPPFVVRILIPQGASGVIIGRAGANIKEISTLTDTRLQLSDSSDPYGTNERIVNITGPHADNVKNAAQYVLENLLDNRKVGNFTNVTTSYPLPPSVQHQTSNIHLLPRNSPQFHGHPQSFPYMPPLPSLLPSLRNLPSVQHSQFLVGNQSPPAPPSHTSLYSQGPIGFPLSNSIPVTHSPITVSQMAIPDNLVGIIVGKSGAVMKGIMSETGARIQISQKGDFVVGTMNRKVTIEGNQLQVNAASSAISSLLTNHQRRNAFD